MSLGNLTTLKCITCDRPLLKVYYREGHGEVECKIKAVCPCGGESFVRHVKGTCNIAPEPDLVISSHFVPDIEFTIDKETNNKIPDHFKLGTTVFLLKEINGKD